MFLEPSRATRLSQQNDQTILEGSTGGSKPGDYSSNQRIKCGRGESLCVKRIRVNEDGTECAEGRCENRRIGRRQDDPGRPQTTPSFRATPTAVSPPSAVEYEQRASPTPTTVRFVATTRPIPPAAKDANDSENDEEEEEERKREDVEQNKQEDTRQEPIPETPPKPTPTPTPTRVDIDIEALANPSSTSIDRPRYTGGDSDIDSKAEFEPGSNEPLPTDDISNPKHFGRPEPAKGRLTALQAAGISLGGIIILILLAISAFCLTRRRRRKTYQEKFMRDRNSSNGTGGSSRSRRTVGDCLLLQTSSRRPSSTPRLSNISRPEGVAKPNIQYHERPVYYEVGTPSVKELHVEPQELSPNSFARNTRTSDESEDQDKLGIYRMERVRLNDKSGPSARPVSKSSWVPNWI